MDSGAMKNDTSFKVVDGFNRSGFPFQGAVLEETGRLFSGGRSRWVFEVEEYPVCVGDRSGRIDFVLRRRDRDWFMLAECKLVQPGGGWGFARSGYVRRDYNDEQVLVDELFRSSPDRSVRRSLVLDFPARPVYHQGVVVSSTDLAIDSKFKPNRDAIESACNQVFLGVNGFLNQLAKSDELWGDRAVLIPVVFTTAPLLVVDRKLSEADLKTGKLPDDTEVEQVPWLWLRQHLSPRIQSSLQIDRTAQQRNLPGTLSRQLDIEFGRTVAVVNYSGIEEFLAFASLDY